MDIDENLYNYLLPH